MQTIKTKYLGATNNLGSRIKATTTGGISKTINYPQELSGVACFAMAAKELAKKMGWTGKMIGGSLNDSGDEYVFVFADDYSFKV